jgi:hypothetical protein
MSRKQPRLILPAARCHQLCWRTGVPTHALATRLTLFLAGKKAPYTREELLKKF